MHYVWIYGRYTHTQRVRASDEHCNRTHKPYRETERERERLRKKISIHFLPAFLLYIFVFGYQSTLFPFSFHFLSMSCLRIIDVHENWLRHLGAQAFIFVLFSFDFYFLDFSFHMHDPASTIHWMCLSVGFWCKTNEYIPQMRRQNHSTLFTCYCLNSQFNRLKMKTERKSRDKTNFFFYSSNFISFLFLFSFCFRFIQFLKMEELFSLFSLSIGLRLQLSAIRK